MSRHDEKGKRFEFLVKQIDNALDNGYYVEAMSLVYALMEERTYSLMDKLNIHYNRGDKLYQCLTYLKDHLTNHDLTIVPLKKTLPEVYTCLENELINSQLVDNIQVWRDQRNKVIHDLAKQDIEYSSIQAIAQNGRDYFRQYTAIIMRLKKVL